MTEEQKQALADVMIKVMGFLDRFYSLGAVARLLGIPSRLVLLLDQAPEAVQNGTSDEV